jgi:methionine--tRNA ligase beta chain
VIYLQFVSDTISFSDFEKVDLRVGKVLEASFPEGSEKLIRLRVDFKDEERIIFTGLKAWYEPEFFQDKLFIFVYNLEPRKMMGEESQGMLLAVHIEDDEKPTEGKPLPVEAPLGSNPGQKLT